MEHLLSIAIEITRKNTSFAKMITLSQNTVEYQLLQELEFGQLQIEKY